MLAPAATLADALALRSASENDARFGQFYSPEDLNELEWLFDPVWAMFKAQHPTREVPDEDLKTNLREPCSLRRAAAIYATRMSCVLISWQVSRLVRAMHGGVQNHAAIANYRETCLNNQARIVSSILT
jgi:hypothetical protein